MIPVRYKIWSIKDNRYLTEDDSYSFGITPDGKLVEFSCCSAGTDAWLYREDVSTKYEIHMEKEGEHMNNIDLNKYKIKEVIQNHDTTHDEMIQYLSGILNDRSIPEGNKVDIRKQYEEIIRIKSILMKPPTIILKPKETE